MIVVKMNDADDVVDTEVGVDSDDETWRSHCRGRIRFRVSHQIVFYDTAAGDARLHRLGVLFDHPSTIDVYASRQQSVRHVIALANHG